MVDQRGQPSEPVILQCHDVGLSRSIPLRHGLRGQSQQLLQWNHLSRALLCRSLKHRGAIMVSGTRSPRQIGGAGFVVGALILAMDTQQLHQYMEQSASGTAGRGSNIKPQSAFEPIVEDNDVLATLAKTYQLGCPLCGKQLHGEERQCWGNRST